MDRRGWGFASGALASKQNHLVQVLEAFPSVYLSFSPTNSDGALGLCYSLIWNVFQHVHLSNK